MYITGNILWLDEGFSLQAGADRFMSSMQIIFQKTKNGIAPAMLLCHDLRLFLSVIIISIFKPMIRRFAVVLSSLLLLAGCVSPTPPVSPAAEADADAAYIAGQFSRSKGINFAFVIRSTDGKRKYTLAMGEDTRLPTEVKDSAIAIKIRPGTYQITEWVTYSTLSKETIARKPINDDSPLSRPFTVQAGLVTHLGNYQVSSTKSVEGVPGYGGGIRYHMRIQPIPTAEKQVQEEFARAYPNLALQPVSCLYCVDTFQP